MNNLSNGNPPVKKVNLGSENFPLLESAIQGELLLKIQDQLAPNGYHYKQLVGHIATIPHLKKEAVMQTLKTVYDFCHNERVRMLKEVEALHEMYTKELDSVRTKIEYEETKDYFRKSEVLLRTFKTDEQVLLGKISIIAYLYKTLNR